MYFFLYIKKIQAVEENFEIVQFTNNHKSSDTNIVRDDIKNGSGKNDITIDEENKVACNDVNETADYNSRSDIEHMTYDNDKSYSINFQIKE